VTCPNCGSSSPIGERSCPQCGSSVGGDTLRFDPAAGVIGNPEPEPGHVRQGKVGAQHVKSPLFFVLLLALFFTVLALALGEWLLGLFLVLITLALALLWASALWDDLEPRLQESTLRTGDAVWRSARMVRVSLTSWSRAGQVEVRMRAKQHQLHRERDSLFRSLGEAVFNGSEERAATLKKSLASNNELIQLNERERRSAWDSAGERVKEERSSTASTETFEVGEHIGSQDPPVPKNSPDTYWQ